jgi:hypothetical protein
MCSCGRITAMLLDDERWVPIVSDSESRLPVHRL